MSEYEFNEKENKQFVDFSLRLLILSATLGAAGFVSIILGLISPFSATDVITGIAFVAIGVSLFLPVQNFKNIISTKGNDMKELMKGFSILNQGFTFVLGATLFLQIMILIGYLLDI
ncbi:MAG: hypothetical protein HeimC2_11960 [Candidatus Heimdallarchaeota archaeon LC_2]|nr:MAG: hypothetical protein HeimC2_11960 [Candidatus Heimdallarchaeota archaeon LC_2]